MGSMRDDADMKRMIKGIYTRYNILVNRFRQCNDEVKFKLFKLYHSSFYCFNLWSRFTLSSFRKVQNTYNKVFRKCLNVDKNIMYNVMLLNGVKSFKEIERDLLFAFKNIVFKSGNMIMQCISHFFIF